MPERPARQGESAAAPARRAPAPARPATARRAGAKRSPMALISVKQAGWGAQLARSRLVKAGISLRQRARRQLPGPIQVVAPNTLANYAEQVQRLTAGCSVIARGTLVQSQGKGQSFEIQADEVTVLGFVDDPETYPMQPKAHTAEFLREVAHLRPRTNTFGAISRVRHSPRDGDSPLLHRRGLLLGQHADHHRGRRRGRRADVPRFDARPGQPAAHRAGRLDFSRTSSARRPTSPSRAS
jgi:hypothetical protein